MKWIKIEDELPKEEQRVIYYFKGTGIGLGYYSGKVWPDKSNCFYGADGWLTDDVTHWMPTPEVPGDE